MPTNRWHFNIYEQDKVQDFGDLKPEIANLLNLHFDSYLLLWTKCEMDEKILASDDFWYSIIVLVITDLL